jgi:hypothetical protein
LKKTEHLIEYLGRYIYKTAIGNHRIRKIDDQGVLFSYKDYRDNSRIKEMFLPGEEFLRRFCLHIQQKGFRKIRYFGIMATSNRKQLLQIKADLNPLLVNTSKKKKWKQIIREKWKYDPFICPQCRKGIMVTVEVINPSTRPPPSVRAANIS